MCVVKYQDVQYIQIQFIYPIYNVQGHWSDRGRYCHDFHRSRVLSLFGRRSAVGVAGLLAIINPFFIFHVFCLVFPHTWFQFPQSICLLVSDGFLYPISCYFYAVGFAIKRLRLITKFCSPASDFPATDYAPLTNVDIII